jgi:hypothetical protein
MFDQSRFSPVSSHASDSPAVYTYITGDTLAAVQGVGYFIDKQFQLEKGDILLVHTSGDVHTKLIVGSDTSTATRSKVASLNVLTETFDDGSYLIDSGTYTDIGLSLTIDVESSLTQDAAATVNLVSLLGTNNNTVVELAMVVDGIVEDETSLVIGNTEVSVNITLTKGRQPPEISGSAIEVKVQALNLNGNVTINNSPAIGLDSKLSVSQSIDVEI